MLAMPSSAQSRCLAATYQRLAGSSPTRIVPRPGTTPRAASACTRPRSSDLIAARVVLPFRIVAVTRAHDAIPTRHPGPARTDDSRQQVVDRSSVIHRDQPLTPVEHGDLGRRDVPPICVALTLGWTDVCPTRTRRLGV